jgi:excisionase family DNA binding protein
MSNIILRQRWNEVIVLDRPEEYVSPRECARLLSVTVRTVYKLVYDGRLPGAVRTGRSIRIPQTAVSKLPSCSNSVRATAAGADDV